jgi:4-amino-4-deoxy-L-arabinose transferase-like glycosyltransferase
MRREDIRNVALGAALFAVLLLPLRGAFVDDTFIHLQYARNLAATGELSFNRGEPTYGATSPLWVAILALFAKAGADLTVWCRVLSWLFAAASIALVYRIAAASGGRPWTPVAAALMLAAEAWFVRWSAVGMETSFAVFTTLVVMDAARSAARSAGRSALLGVALFLAAITRPEALLLVPLAAAALLFAKGTARRFSFLLVFAPLFAAWLFVIHRHTGSYFPLTAGAKQGAIDLSPLVLLRRAAVPARIMGATVLFPWIALLAGLAAGAFRRRAPGWYLSESGSLREEPGVLLMLLWLFALPLAYVALDFQVLSRYLVPVVPAAIVLGATAWRKLVADVVAGARKRRAVFSVFVALSILQSVVFYELVVVPPTRAFSEALETMVGGMGRWLDRNAPADALVAAPDIGVIGYYSHRRILDLGGLVTPEINRMRREIDVGRIIEEGLYLRFGPDYLVDRDPFPERFAREVIKGVRFETVMKGEVPNLGIRKPEPVIYVLYRLERVEEAGKK